MPMNSAITMAGIGATRPTSGAAVTAATATTTESAMPGPRVRSVAAARVMGAAVAGMLVIEESMVKFAY